MYRLNITLINILLQIYKKFYQFSLKNKAYIHTIHTYIIFQYKFQQIRKIWLAKNKYWKLKNKNFTPSFEIKKIKQYQNIQKKY